MNKQEILLKCEEILEEPNSLSSDMKDFFESVRDLVVSTSSPSLCPTETFKI